MKMAKYVLSILITFILLIALTQNVFASEATKLSITSNLEELKKGSQLIVTVSISSVDTNKGINALFGKLTYDSEILSYVNAKSLNNWGNVEINTNNKSEKFGAFVIENSNDVKEKSGILQFTFDILNNPKESTTVSITDIKAVLGEEEVALDSLKLSLKGGNEEVPNEKVVLTKIEILEKASKLEYTEGEKFDVSGMKIQATYSDNTTKNITDYEYAPKTELSSDDKEIVISYTENGVTKTISQEIKVNAKKTNNEEGKVDSNKVTTNNTNKDKENEKGTESGKETSKNNKTESSSSLPKAGKESILIISMIITCIIVVISYKNYNKYKKIK